ncbi:MAG TPA: hypothetical protein VFZ59_18400 [Verrucomicrobiae bacterium]|nr:hypothetical protein [Verrucomicrobiae bacterium]
MKPITANLFRPIIIHEIGGTTDNAGIRIAAPYATARIKGRKYPSNQ